MICVALVGANGYVGSALACALRDGPGLTVTSVTRSNYAQMRRCSYDILINAAMPSQRFWAKNHPALDFLETVQKTADLIYDWRFKKFIQISTLSARCQLDTVYGRHKVAAEKICGYGDNLIVRLGPMYSKELSKGVLIDILKGERVYIDAESRYCFAPLEFVATWIVNNLDRAGIVEVGARNTVSLREVAHYIGVNPVFDGPVDHQEIMQPEEDYPDARGVLRFIDEMKGRFSYDSNPVSS